MKKLFEAFRVPKSEKISDKTFMFNIVACMAGIVICLSSLTAVTWAWFGGSVSSSSNTIQTARYDMSIKVYDGDNKEVLPNASAGYQYLLSADTEYTVTLKGAGTGSGYCRITDNKNAEKIYYTSQVRSSDTEATVFTLKFTEATVINILPCWGTYIGAEESRDLMGGGEYVNFGNASMDSTTESADGESQEGNSETTVNSTDKNDVPAESGEQ